MSTTETEAAGTQATQATTSAASGGAPSDADLTALVVEARRRYAGHTFSAADYVVRPYHLRAAALTMDLADAVERLTRERDEWKAAAQTAFMHLAETTAREGDVTRARDALAAALAEVRRTGCYPAPSIAGGGVTFATTDAPAPPATLSPEDVEKIRAASDAATPTPAAPGAHPTPETSNA